MYKFLGTEAMTNLDSILKRRDITLLMKVCIVKGFSIVNECMIQDAWGWCTGMTQRDGTGREVEGVFRIAIRVHPWWFHVDVWQNQYNIVK